MLALMLLAVLTIYLAFAVAITRWLTGLPRFARHRLLVGALSILAFVLIPTGDEIVGRAYLRYRCGAEGGVRIYKTIMLGPEYWNTDGTPNFVTINPNKPTVVLGGRYKFAATGYQRYPGLLDLRRYQVELADADSGEVAGAYTEFAFSGGWLMNHIPGHYAKPTCPDITSATVVIINKVFTKN